MRNLIIVFCFFSVFGNAQEYADKEYYLVDSLNLNALSEFEKSIIDSCVSLFHSKKTDTSRVGAVFSLVQGCKNVEIEFVYCLWLNNHVNVLLKSNISKNELELYNEVIIEVLSNIGYYYQFYNGDLNKSFSFFEEGLNLSDQIDNQMYRAYFLNNIGHLYYTWGDMNKAIEFFSKSLKISEKIEDKGGCSLGYNNLGSIYLKNNDTLNALVYFEKSYESFKTLNHKQGMATTLSNMGAVYRGKGSFNIAIKMFKESLEIRRLINDERDVINSLNNIGTLFLEKAKISIDNKERLGYLDSMTLCFNESLEISNQLGDNYSRAVSYMKLGEMSMLKGNVDLAENYGLKSYNLASQNNYAEELVDITFFLSEL